MLLELEWVLRGFYLLPRRDIVRAIRALAGIEHLVLEDGDAVLSALEAVDRGLDFADALHMARSARATAFATFDKRLAKRAKSLDLALTAELLG